MLLMFSASDVQRFWWRVFRSSSSGSFLQTQHFRGSTSDAALQTQSSRCFKLQNKFLCSWTCSIRIFKNSTLNMDPAHLNKLFSISNWLFLIPCYCQNSIGDLWNTLVPTVVIVSTIINISLPVYPCFWYIITISFLVEEIICLYLSKIFIL